MNPETGQLVKVYFRNGFTSEGVVQSWSDGKSVLKAVESSNLLIIQKTIEDILFVQVIFTEQPAQVPSQKLQFYEELPEVEERDPHLRAKSLLELQKLRRETEAENVKHHLTNLKNRGVSVPQYDDPYARVFNLPKSASFNPSKKA